MKKFLFISLLAAFILSPILSIQAATATVPQLKTTKDIYSQFQRDLANRYKHLDSISPRRTGKAGLNDFFITNAVITPATFNAAIVSVGGTSVPVIKAPTLERLEWFRGQLLNSPAGVLDARDKDGISLAMKGRLVDLEIERFQNEAETKILVKTQTAIFKTALNNAAKTRITAITTCVSEYKTALTNLASANPDYTVFGRYIANAELTYTRDNCANTAWTAYYASIDQPVKGMKDAYRGLMSWQPLQTKINEILANTYWAWDN